MFGSGSWIRGADGPAGAGVGVGVWVGSVFVEVGLAMRGVLMVLKPRLPLDPRE